MTPRARIASFDLHLTAGRDRLYLQFKHAGQVRTAEFTSSAPR
jgi:hypothetical protein